jgi:D-alanyl-D-alanine carboxypeptidase/D-alanyl-D-alanine-endopeptidase (penicillin-binding protein 4)
MSHRLRHIALLLSLLLLVFGLSGGATAGQADPLGQDLDRILADPRLDGASAGLVVRDADTGESLYTRFGANRLLPASNAKLVTTATALEALGPDYRMRTDVLADGPRLGSVLRGNLYLRGTGDPTLLAKDYQAMAAKLAANGVRVVTGSLVADDTWFDDVRLGESWAWDDEPYYYSGQTSALTVSPDTDYDAGSIIVRVRPGEPGQPAKVEVDPPTDFVRIDNTAVTTGAGGISIDREHGTNVIRVRGTIAPGGAAVTQFIAVWHPTGLVASIFRKALADNGVTLVGPTEFRSTPANAQVLDTRESMPLRELVVPLLKLSNNMHAEILVKAAGRKASGVGSWPAGLAALRAKLPGLGINPNALRLVDGSGLSRMDVISPDQLVSLMTAARGKPWFGYWYDALPVAGKADRMVGGTLRNRMRGTPAAGNVHAKTGSMTGVTALSGYVTTADGRNLVFSFLQNNFVAGSPQPLEDAIAIRLASDRKGAARLEVASTADAPVLECGWTKSC